MTKNEEIIQTAHRRYATKKFNPNKKINVKDWNTIMEVARLAPSSMGLSPWKILLIDNAEIKQAIYNDAWGAQKSLDGASHFVIILARKHMTATNPHVKHITEDVRGHEYDPESAFSKKLTDFQKHDFNLNSDQALFDWASKQTYILLANMMTAAAELDLDSCPIEGFNRAKVEATLVDRGLFDPEKWGISVMAGFGYRDQPITPKKRQPMAEIYKVVK
jgi:nitroreductase